MIKLRLSGLAFGMLAALSMSAGFARAADEGCKFVRVGELPVKFDENQPLVSVSINGKPGWLLIDTGSESTVIWGGAARQYGLHLNSTGGKFYGVGGSQDVSRTIVAEFELAGQKNRDVGMFVIGHGGSEARSGILGRDLLGYYDVEFDLAGGKVRLWQAFNCGRRSLAYWTKSPLLAELTQDEALGEYKISAEINGKSLKATLDSGATTTVITPEIAALAGARKEDYAAGVSESGGIGEKKVEVRLAAFDSVTIGDEQIKHTRLEVSDLFKDDTYNTTGSILEHRLEDTTSMLLGADFLRAHRVLLSPKQNLMYFTYNGGPIFQVVGDPAKVKPPGGFTAIEIGLRLPADFGFRQRSSSVRRLKCKAAACATQLYAATPG